MSDYIIRGMAADKQVRFFAANTKELVEKARQIHNTSPIATAALGRLMTGTAMMGSMCKNDSDIVTVQIKGDGPMGGLVVMQWFSFLTEPVSSLLMAKNIFYRQGIPSLCQRKNLILFTQKKTLSGFSLLYFLHKGIL